MSPVEKQILKKIALFAGLKILIYAGVYYSAKAARRAAMKNIDA